VRILCCLLLLLSASLASAGPQAVAAFAPAQLRIAEQALREAGEARAEGDYRRAGRLAAMAELDARLAWAMSDSQLLRRLAAGISQCAALVRAQLVAGREQAALIRP